MNELRLLSILLLCCGCSDTNQNSHQTLSDIQVVNYDTLLKKTDDGWLYNGQPFSGFMVEKELDDRIVYRLPINDGKENGMAKGWYNTGEKLLERPFIDGKKEGVFKQWWPNGRLRYLFIYTNDQFNGTQWVYYPTGIKREQSNYLKGEKEGVQRVWDEKGVLVSNYTIKNKKIYGIMSVKSCIPSFH